ncbi:MAG: hypothetical protein ACRCTJ_06455 [Brevinema sp.]
MATFRNNNNTTQCTYIHDKKFDIPVLQKCLEILRINIYAIVENTNLAKIIPIASEKDDYFVGIQEKNYI